MPGVLTIRKVLPDIGRGEVLDLAPRLDNAAPPEYFYIIKNARKMNTKTLLSFTELSKVAQIHARKLFIMDLDISDMTEAEFQAAIKDAEVEKNMLLNGWELFTEEGNPALSDIVSLDIAEGQKVTLKGDDILWTVVETFGIYIKLVRDVRGAKITNTVNVSQINNVYSSSTK